jgi:hypothetical protein
MPTSFPAGPQGFPKTLDLSARVGQFPSTKMGQFLAEKINPPAGGKPVDTAGSWIYLLDAIFLSISS